MFVEKHQSYFHDAREEACFQLVMKHFPASLFFLSFLQQQNSQIWRFIVLMGQEGYEKN